MGTWLRALLVALVIPSTSGLFWKGKSSKPLAPKDQAIMTKICQHFTQSGRPHNWRLKDCTNHFNLNNPDYQDEADVCISVLDGRTKCDSGSECLSYVLGSPFRLCSKAPCALTGDNKVYSGVLQFNTGRGHGSPYSKLPLLSNCSSDACGWAGVQCSVDNFNAPYAGHTRVKILDLSGMGLAGHTVPKALGDLWPDCVLSRRGFGDFGCYFSNGTENSAQLAAIMGDDFFRQEFLYETTSQSLVAIFLNNNNLIGYWPEFRQPTLGMLIVSGNRMFGVNNIVPGVEDHCYKMMYHPSCDRACNGYTIQNLDVALGGSAGYHYDPPQVSMLVSDRAVLMNLYDATVGDNWTQSDNWGVGDPCLDSWYGVVCAWDGTITLLQLQNNNLVGYIPPDLASLTNAKTMFTLDLSVREGGGDCTFHSYFRVLFTHLLPRPILLIVLSSFLFSFFPSFLLASWLLCCFASPLSFQGNTFFCNIPKAVISVYNDSSIPIPCGESDSPSSDANCEAKCQLQ